MFSDLMLSLISEMIRNLMRRSMYSGRSMTNDSQSKPPTTSEPTETTDPSTTGAPTPKVKRSVRRPMRPDHPLLSRGWIVGGRYSTSSSNNTPGNLSEPEKTQSALTPEEEAEEERIGRKRIAERFKPRTKRE
jgi:hypothetical protein